MLAEAYDVGWPKAAVNAPEVGQVGIEGDIFATSARREEKP